jgi:hypothetical protein
MSIMLPPRVESAFAQKGQVVKEAFPPQSETYTIGKVDEYADAINLVRTMITMAIGTLKEVKAKVREVPGARFLIGEILSCLGSAQVATTVKPSQLQFKQL